MDIAGFYVKWKNNKIEIYDDIGKYYFTAYRKEHFYIVYACYEGINNEVYNAEINSRATADTMKIHRRFFHVKINSVDQKERYSLIFQSNTHNNVKQYIFERVYIDVWGPSPVASVGGCNYFLSIIDDFLRKTFLYIGNTT